MADQTAESVSRGLFQGWIYIHYPPRVMLSDQGPNVHVKFRAVQSSEDEQVAYAVSKGHSKFGRKTELEYAEPKCFGCGEPGHLIRTCPEKKKCTNCGRWGHRVIHCRSKGGQHYASKAPRNSRDVYQVSGSERQ